MTRVGDNPAYRPSLARCFFSTTYTLLCYPAKDGTEPRYIIRRLLFPLGPVRRQPKDRLSRLLIDHARVDRRGAQVRMTQERLDHPDIRPLPQKVRRKGGPEAMRQTRRYLRAPAPVVREAFEHPACVRPAHAAALLLPRLP